MNMISKKAQEIPPFIVMDVLEKAQELERMGERIIHLEVGEPDFDTPECINEACFGRYGMERPTTPTVWV